MTATKELPSNRRSGEVVIQKKTLILTDTQIKAQTSGDFGIFEIVPAQGENLFIHFLSGIISSDVSGGIYGVDPTITMAFALDADPENGNVLDISNIIDASGASYLLGAAGNGVGKYVSFVTTGTDGDNHEFQFGVQSDWVNKNLGFRMYNNNANLTGGHSGNTMKVTAIYAIIEL